MDFTGYELVTKSKGSGRYVSKPIQGSFKISKRNGYAEFYLSINFDSLKALGWKKGDKVAVLRKGGSYFLAKHIEGYRLTTNNTQRLAVQMAINIQATPLYKTDLHVVRYFGEIHEDYVKIIFLNQKEGEL